MDLKADLCPGVSPGSWELHMKTLWSGQQRVKHPVLSRLDPRSVAVQVGALLNKFRKLAFVTNIARTAVVGSRAAIPRAKHRARDEAYIGLVMRIIHDLTAKGAQPRLYFDSTKPLPDSAATVIHGWARDAFRGSQHCLLYTWVAHGIEVPEPQFVRPASHPCLELADFVSFTVARYHLRKWQNRGIEIDPAVLGSVEYVGFDRRDDMVYQRADTYPWRLFYG